MSGTDTDGSSYLLRLSLATKDLKRMTTLRNPASVCARVCVCMCRWRDDVGNEEEKREMKWIDWKQSTGDGRRGASKTV